MLVGEYTFIEYNHFITLITASAYLYCLSIIILLIYIAVSVYCSGLWCGAYLFNSLVSYERNDGLSSSIFHST